MEIITFNPNYALDFQLLNEAWLKKYFVIEPYDSILLSQCEEVIIKPGGFIFFVKIKNQIIGTAAFIYKSKGIYELGKMAVKSEFQGQKIGQKLMHFMIKFAEEHHWSKIILYSNTKLKNALYVYIKYGFIEIPLEQNLPYKRSDIKMELDLKQIQ
tara:strand:- start:449 stop:916 length:468 start_codon:yes stop_codon:yes gene_type:complete